MRGVALVLAFAALHSAPSLAQNDWRWTADGLVQYPAGVFVKMVGNTDRHRGMKYSTIDGQSTFAVYSFHNTRGETPARYLSRTLMVDPKRIIYKRVTPAFFVISDIRSNMIYYSRCNFGALVRCIYLEYPAAEKREWDAAVTRMSHSLR